MKIGLLGCGTVGGGVLKIAESRKDLSIKYVLVRRERPELGALAVKDIETILQDPEVEVVVEVLGGLHPSYDYVSQALKAGKSIVTANKYLVAHHYKELISLADRQHVAFRCTAAVGGGIPWLVNLQRAARVNPIQRFYGIMNGTTNFILDSMETNGSSFADVLAKAQEMGYAEADPSADIDGLDVQRKCIISANIAFGGLLKEEEVPVAGIRCIQESDIRAAHLHGRCCRLMATGCRTKKGISAYIQPEFLPDRSLECAVRQNFNMISFETEYTGRESFYGQGAGRFPTAYNVVEDLLDIQSGERRFYAETGKEVPIDNEAEAMPYYFRTRAEDAWLQEKSLERWADGVLTEEISVREAHAQAARLRQQDAELFFAGVR